MKYETTQTSEIWNHYTVFFCHTMLFQILLHCRIANGLHCIPFHFGVNFISSSSTRKSFPLYPPPPSSLPNCPGPLRWRAPIRRAGAESAAGPEEAARGRTPNCFGCLASVAVTPLTARGTLPLSLHSGLHVEILLLNPVLSCIKTNPAHTSWSVPCAFSGHLIPFFSILSQFRDFKCIGSVSLLVLFYSSCLWPPSVSERICHMLTFLDPKSRPRRF